MKLNTPQLKDKILQWIQRSESKTALSQEGNESHFPELLKRKNWVRIYKSKLTEDNDTYDFSVFVHKNRQGGNMFATDLDGECDQSLVDFYSDPENAHLREKLTIRAFSIHERLHMFSDFMINILTDHNDEVIVGWVLTVD
jgi:hypothetical protein